MMSEEVKVDISQKVEKSVYKNEEQTLDKEKTVNGSHFDIKLQETVNSSLKHENVSEDTTKAVTEEKSYIIDNAQTETSTEQEKSTKNEEIKNEKEEKDSKTDEDYEEKPEEEDDEESSDEELPPGLLERPVQILEDKRRRKKTTRFTYDDVPTPSSDKKKVEIAQGRGVRLGDQPRVEWQLGRNKAEDLKIIHKLFFGVFGDVFSCKKNIRNFTGFPFEKDSKEFERKEDYIGRFTLDNLKWALTVCDIENKKGKKEELIDRFLEWCLSPKPSGKEVPEKKVKKEKIKKKKSKKSSSKNQSNASITSDDVSDDDDDAETDKDEVTPQKTKKTKKTPQKKPSAKVNAKSTPKSPKKRTLTSSPKKMAKVKIGSLKKSDNVDSDDDTPLQKKSKKPPTDAQIRKEVAKILKGADLEVITMKAVCLKVYEIFPDFDLSDRKAFIKETVKSIIS